MTNLKNNIDNYMKLKGIKKYSNLLYMIARELKLSGKDAYVFARKEKSNFSKMLKGERPLKHEFIIPLEKIFGISLARLTYEDAYKMPVDKEYVPFIKGFRYYAYLDDPVLYKNELSILLSNDAKSILTNKDEFGKGFIDYVVEYGAINGVKYLYDEYQICLKWFNNLFYFNIGKEMIICINDKVIEFARLVASINDVELFYSIFDSYNMFYSNGYYAGDSIFNSPDFIEILLENENLFNSLFVIKSYDYELGNCGKRKYKKEIITYNSINPIINNCLNYALTNLDKYKEQAIKILKFGINYNKGIQAKIDTKNCTCNSELGRLNSFINDDVCECVIVVNNINVSDNEIKSLIDRLPKF